MAHLLAAALDPDPKWGQDPSVFVAMMVVGFVIGVLGHVFRSRATVAVGVFLILLATFLLPLATNVLRS